LKQILSSFPISSNQVCPDSCRSTLQGPLEPVPWRGQWHHVWTHPLSGGSWY